MDLLNDFICKYCREFYFEPVFLTCCGENICKTHIKELLKKKESECPMCRSYLKNQNFTINKVLNNLMAQEIYKLKIDPAYQDVLYSLKEKIKKIEIMHSDSENLIDKKIQELKRQVDLDREEAKAEIDKQADELINKLDMHQNELIKEAKSKEVDEYYSKLIKNANNNLGEYENCLKSFGYNDDYRKKKKNEIEQLMKDLDAEMENYERKLFKNQNSFTYESMRHSVSYKFGRLIVNFCF